ncbi:hypothetical protein F0U61_12080 [Archangium violaceum]|uniref:hypothetical protein n=1 Tax=Archangium violaceum TaxID=83451 RepID=UPI002B2E3521|nr:hypothetical protein F0U61_12080 [Archangium violaceum]
MLPHLPPPGAGCRKGPGQLGAASLSDTHGTYNASETQLTDAQKPRARELISQEREKLPKQHEAMRQQLGGDSP